MTNETRALPMTDGEIAVSYRQAKNRRAQIGVLAELNACSRDRISEILERMGYTVKRRKKAVYVKRRAYTPEDDAEILRLHRDGLTSVQIAPMVGRSPSSVCGRIHQLRSRDGDAMPPPYTGSPRYTEAEDAEFVRAVREGRTAAQIADALGRTKNSVQQHAKILLRDGKITYKEAKRICGLR